VDHDQRRNRLERGLRRHRRGRWRLIRSLVGAIAVALAWITLIEGIVGQLVGGLARWLPFNAGQALGAGARAMSTNDHLLPRWGGGAVLAGYTLVFVVAAVATTVRRDVS
jgi:ABC-2 type transport system permease protein